MPLRIIRQDISKMDCDAIVNPTNINFEPSGGADLAIHKAAGDELRVACKNLGMCQVGQAKITSGYNLKCKYIIHTSGPKWCGGVKGEKELLISCYKSCLELACEYDCKSIAFPLISSGAYGYPKDKVLSVALEVIQEFLFKNEMDVYLVVFDKHSYELGSMLVSDIAQYIDERYVERKAYRSMSRISQAVVYDRCCDDRADFYDHSIENLIIKVDKKFAYKLYDLIDAKGMTNVECYKKANVSKQTWYKIETDKNYKPNKKTVISFAIALELTLDETQSLLESVGFVLSKSSLFDVIIMYCIENKIYDVFEIDSILFKYDEETLYSKS